jgi:hypothetical protein
MAKAFYRRSVVHKIVAMVLRKTKNPTAQSAAGSIGGLALAEFLTRPQSA